MQNSKDKKNIVSKPANIIKKQCPGNNNANAIDIKKDMEQRCKHD